MHCRHKTSVFINLLTLNCKSRGLIFLTFLLSASRLSTVFQGPYKEHAKCFVLFYALAGLLWFVNFNNIIFLMILPCFTLGAALSTSLDRWHIRCINRDVHFWKFWSMGEMGGVSTPPPKKIKTYTFFAIKTHFTGLIIFGIFMKCRTINVLGFF